MGRACQRAPRTAPDPTQYPKHGSHTAPPRPAPAAGPCSTTQIDDGSRLSAGTADGAGSDAVPETRVSHGPDAPRARGGAVFVPANRRWVALYAGPGDGDGYDGVPAPGGPRE